MPAERLKFRCYRCNQLLAVAPTKAGSVVACPKCQAELQIPSAEPQAQGDGPFGPGAAGVKLPVSKSPAAAAAAEELPSFLEEIAGGIPPEVADLRPEDLRVEAEFFESLTRQPPAPASPELFPATPTPAPEPWLPPLPPEETSQFSPPVGSAFSPEAMAGTPVPVQAPPPVPSPQPALEVPPIEIEPPSILPPGTEVRRVHEVILPASVVLAWSVFVLVAVAMSFLAGLVIGHFLWKPLP